jgi:hypothetical protein
VHLPGAESRKPTLALRSSLNVKTPHMPKSID